jgi:hypothetical protein
MIRFLVPALALCVFSFSAHATPKVGDTAVYDVKLGLNDQSAEGVLQVELAQFDMAKNAYLERQSFTLQGRAPETSESWKTSEEYLSDSVIEQLLANCQARGGLAQKIYVGAGEFSTCAVAFDTDDSKGVLWIGQAPFGIVKSDIVRKDNGMTISNSLRSYK